MKIDIHTHKLLDRFCCNHEWISDCLDSKTSAFPYQINQQTQAKPRLEHYDRVPSVQQNVFPDAKGIRTATYLINIPLGYLSLKKEPRSLQRVIRLIEREAFGSTPQVSRNGARKKIALVIGINHWKSIDPEVNKEFEQTIENLPVIGTVANRFFGFQWNPVWKCKEEIKHLLSKEKAFKVLKILNHKRSQEVLSFVENTISIRKQIPYTLIRERLLHSPQTRAFDQHFAATCPKNPTYFVTMDSDLQSLREGNGIFTKANQFIKGYDIPSAINFGYNVPENELPLVKLAIKLDMAARAGMNLSYPFAAYFPEPFSLFLSRYPNHPSFLEKFSFKGASLTLENRRLIQNGLVKGLFKRYVLFIPKGDIVMETPHRMKAATTMCSVLHLTKRILKQKSTLRTLRGLSQSHIFPREWACNLYAAIPFNCSRVTDVTTPMMDIFKHYDPISRILETTPYTRNTFERILDKYHREITSPINIVQNQLKEPLRELKMPEELIKEIIAVAKSTGTYVYHALKTTYDNLPD